VLAATPIYEQVLGEKGRNDHAQAIVHPTGRVQTAHRGIHNRVSRLSRAPGLKVGFLSRPINVVILWLEGVIDHRWMVGQNVLIEFPPDKFGQPFLSRHSVGLGAPHAFPDRDCAKSQVYAQAAGSGGGREVSV